MSETDIHKTARSLADDLEEAKKFYAAACVYIEYLDEVENSARLFCRAYMFSDAIGLVTRRNMPSLLTEIVDSGLLDGFTTISELLADCKSQIRAQVSRLEELRVKREQEPRELTSCVPFSNSIKWLTLLETCPQAQMEIFRTIFPSHQQICLHRRP
jgi:elongator complex protein 1